MPKTLLFIYSFPLEVSRRHPHNFLIGSAIFSLVSGIYDPSQKGKHAVEIFRADMTLPAECSHVRPHMMA